ncbi:MAG: ABC transporter ATP-binding protein [Gemmataceae bacterium]
MSIAVSTHHLSKKFLVPHADGPRSAYRYRTFRDELMRLATWPVRLFKGAGTRQPACDDFWALDDVNFEIGRGEVVGIIGRNGAGKSTLLKILSRITKPTAGEVRLRGRVGSLLEVGTGFHPELTGRENIFLNGAILGMRREEIQRKFEQIVEFAEIGPFLDTPVKRYSSGMYVRLAFAVAAHLEPEILIVDEVLAVGDMAFQRKCLGRMREVGRSGSTILFVSHNMPAVESLCTRAILLDKGKVAHDGGVRELVAEYHRRILETQGEAGANLETVDGPGRTRKILRSCSLLDAHGEPANFVPLGGRFHLRIGVDSALSVDYPSLAINIDDQMGQRVLTLQTPLSHPVIENMLGQGVIDCVVDPFPLAPGDYWIRLAVWQVPDALDEVDRVLRFTVTPGEAFGSGRGFQSGVCIAPSHWTFERRSE